MERDFRPVLAGQKALVIGVANDHRSLTDARRRSAMAGADLAITWLNEKARPYVEPLAPRTRRVDHRRGSTSPFPDNWRRMFDQIRTKWGRLDILVHSIAFAPKERSSGRTSELFGGRVREGDGYFLPFLHSDGEARGALMTDGGTMFAMSYYGANRVVANYNVMGPVKAALEAACRYLAYELGPQGIRVHAISPGPLKTRAAVGPEGLRAPAQRGCPEGAARGACRHHGCRIHLRLSRDAARQAHHRRHRLCRRRRQHCRAMTGSGQRGPQADEVGLPNHEVAVPIHRGDQRRVFQHQVRDLRAR